MVPNMLAAGLAVSLLLGGPGVPAVAANDLHTLADVSRARYGGAVVDLNQDGIITKVNWAIHET
jgi:hypothetical protein